MIPLRLIFLFLKENSHIEDLTVLDPKYEQLN